MHTAIETLLRKRGIESVNDLSPEEKQQYDQWQKVLVNEPITIPRFVEFLNVQKSIVENSLTNLNNSTLVNDRLIVQLNIYSKLLKFLDSDKTEREALIKYLTTLTET